MQGLSAVYSYSRWDYKRTLLNVLMTLELEHICLSPFLNSGKRTASLQLIGSTPRVHTLLITRRSRGPNIANLRLDINLSSDSNVTQLSHSPKRAGSVVREAVDEQAVFGCAAL